eukprot:Amastigsp_a177374_26.p3 type:complete len:147 gc:universal Amastigsp_a177374_26:869-429(-)
MMHPMCRLLFAKSTCAAAPSTSSMRTAAEIATAVVTGTGTVAHIGAAVCPCAASAPRTHRLNTISPAAPSAAQRCADAKYRSSAITRCTPTTPPWKTPKKSRAPKPEFRSVSTPRARSYAPIESAPVCENPAWSPHTNAYASSARA